MGKIFPLETNTSFKIGDILLDVPPEDISITRHENHQSLKYLRQEGSVNIPSGRTTVKIDINFRLLAGEGMADLDKLSRLVAMTRVTPFVPIRNKYVFEHLPITQREFVDKEGNKSYADSLPVAILGMNLIVGGDSPELVDCSMSLLFWNPNPFLGVEEVIWLNSSIVQDNIRQEYDRYLTYKNTNDYKSIPDGVLTLRWEELRTYNQLKANYGIRTTGRDNLQSLQVQAEYGLFTEVGENSRSLGQRYLNKRINDVESRPIEMDERTGVITKIYDGDTVYIGDEAIRVLGADTAEQDSLNPIDINQAERGTLYTKSRIEGKKVKIVSPKNKKDKYGRTLAYVYTEDGKNLADELNNLGYARSPDNFNKPVSINNKKPIVEQLIERFVGRTGLVSDEEGAVRKGQKLIKEWQRTGKISDPAAYEYVKEVLEISDNDAAAVAKRSGFDNADIQRTEYLGVPNREEEVQSGILYTDYDDIKELEEKGWVRVNPEDPRPRDPLFRNVKPNIIELTPTGNINSKDNQVTTAISVAFQNRFSVLPIAGSPYPTLQSLGSHDSMVYISAACKSTSENFQAVKKIQEMAHIMDRRSLDYRAKVFSGREIFAMTKLNITNRVLKSCGLTNFILNSISLNRDPDSPDLARLELSLTENILVDEALRGHKNFSNRDYRKFLFEWFKSRAWEKMDSRGAPVKSNLTKLYSLYQASQKAYLENKSNLIKDRQAVVALKRRLSDLFDEDTNSSRRALTTSLTEGAVPLKNTRTFSDYPSVNGRALTTDYPYIVAYSALPMPTEAYLIGDFLQKVPYSRNNNPLDDAVPIPFPVFGEDMLEAGIVTSLINMGNIWFSTYNLDFEWDRGIISDYLSASAGDALKNLSIRLRELYTIYKERSEDSPEREQVIERYAEIYEKLFELWNEAHKEYYQEVLLTNALWYIATTYPEYFSEFDDLFTNQDSIYGGSRGTYQDLYLGATPNVNPYEWLDNMATQQIRQGLNNFVDRAQNYVLSILEETKNFSGETAQYKTVHMDAGFTQGSDNSKVKKSKEQVAQEYQKGRDGYYTNAKSSVAETLEAMRHIASYQFTCRRAFPTFRFFIIEDEQAGLVKAFDEFYNYNAVLDWTLHEAQFRPATLHIKLANIFGHLDAFILDDNLIDGLEYEATSKGARTEGVKALLQGEKDGLNFQKTANNRYKVGNDLRKYTARGETTDIRDIMLKPGAKVMLKAGFDNDPENLTTIFTGQVTEIAGGEVLDIICQDWGSELMAIWDPDLDGESDLDDIGFFESKFTSNENDLQGTASTYSMISNCLHNKSCRHLGGWQIGPQGSSLGVYAKSWIPRLFRGIFSEEIGSDRSLVNVKPSVMPMYSAFGANVDIVEVPYKGRAMWEIINDLRLYHCNNIFFTRPYNADGTLYFGKPYGVYLTEENQSAGNLATNKERNRRYLEAFKDVIRSGASINLNAIVIDNDGNVSLNGDRWIERRWNGVKSFFGSDIKERLTMQRVPVNDIIGRANVINQLLSLTGPRERELRRKLHAATGASPFKGPQVFGTQPPSNIATPTGNNITIEDARKRQEFNENLLNNKSDQAIEAIWDILQSARFGSRGDGADEFEEIIRLVKQEIDTLVAVKAQQKARAEIEKANEEGEEISGTKLAVLEQMSRQVKPVRQWHIVNSDYHIIDNNIQVSSNFANAIAIEEGEGGFVKYDPGLENVRTRWYPEYENDTYDDDIKPFIAASLLSDNMKRMYRGELIVTGNPEIRPHDILVIHDHVRHIFGMVEVDKVVHSMSLDNGFITIITPALVTEIYDMTLAHAYQAFYSALAEDLEEISEANGLAEVYAKYQSLKFSRSTNIKKFKEQAENNASDIYYHGQAIGAGTATVGLAGIGAGVGTYIMGASILGGPVGIGLAGVALTVGGLAYMSMQAAAVEEHARTHPLTITPLMKRGWPWVAGIDGAAKHTVVGQWAFDMQKSWKDIRNTLTQIRLLQQNIGNTIDTAVNINTLSSDNIPISDTGVYTGDEYAE